jgi:hypothetical protein
VDAQLIQVTQPVDIDVSVNDLLAMIAKYL